MNKTYFLHFRKSNDSETIIKNIILDGDILNDYLQYSFGDVDFLLVRYENGAKIINTLPIKSGSKKEKAIDSKINWLKILFAEKIFKTGVIYKGDGDLVNIYNCIIQGGADLTALSPNAHVNMTNCTFIGEFDDD